MSSELEMNNEGQEVRLGPKTVTVPEYWEKVRIEDVTEIVTRGKQPTYVDEGGVPVLNQSCIYWDGFHEDELRRLDETVAEDWKEKYFVQEGDVLINSTGKGTLGRAICWSESSGEVALDSHITRVSVDQDAISPEYLRYYLESRWGQTMLYVYCVSGSTGQIELSKTDLLSMPILVPSLSEQRRIADVLSTVNDRIQETGEVIEELESLKRGVMQDLYTTGIRDSPQTESTRIGDIPKDWELSTISEFAKIVSGSHVKSDLVTNDDSQTPYITGPADFTRLGFEVSKYTDHPSSFCEEGDTLVTVKGMSCGKSTLADSRVSISRQLKAIRPDDELDEKYLFYWIRYKQQLLHTLAEGTRQLGLSNSDILTFPLPVPPLPEQEKIGEVLFTIDQRISEEREYKEKLQELKRGLMQDLLTGKRHLKTDS